MYVISSMMRKIYCTVGLKFSQAIINFYVWYIKTIKNKFNVAFCSTLVSIKHFVLNFQCVQHGLARCEVNMCVGSPAGFKPCVQQSDSKCEVIGTIAVRLQGAHTHSTHTRINQDTYSNRYIILVDIYTTSIFTHTYNKHRSLSQGFRGKMYQSVKTRYMHVKNEKFLLHVQSI